MLQSRYITYQFKVYSFYKQAKLQWFLIDLKSALILKQNIKCEWYVGKVIAKNNKET